MHLLIPFAATLSQASSHTHRDLHLPQLQALLQRLSPGPSDGGDEYSLSPPHELALARAWGWHGADGALPFAAALAAGDGIPAGGNAWGLLTPVHWHVGREHITLADPLALALSDEESRAYFDAVRELFESEGYRLAWGAAQRWYVAHDSLDGLACASLDRVIGRNVDLWLQSNPQARLLRRLQNEVQMLLYPHPLNEAREARGEFTVNSFWLSGCGRAQPVDSAAVAVDDALRAPALAEDWAGWADAWRALDAGPLAELERQAQRGAAVSLTLCGERRAQRFESAPRSLWQRLASRWQPSALPALIESL